VGCTHNKANGEAANASKCQQTMVSAPLDVRPLRLSRYLVVHGSMVLRHPIVRGGQRSASVWAGHAHAASSSRRDGMYQRSKSGAEAFQVNGAGNRFLVWGWSERWWRQPCSSPHALLNLVFVRVAVAAVAAGRMMDDASRSAWLKALRGHLRELRAQAEALVELEGSQRKALSWEVGQPLLE